MDRLSLNELTEEILEFLSKTPLENLIAFKFLTTFALVRGKYYNFPVWKNLHKIVNSALRRFILSYTSSPEEAKLLLGLSEEEYKEFILDK